MSNRPVKKSVRFSKDEIQKIDQFLLEHDLSFSDYARSKILNLKLKSKLNERLIYEINKIGTNLNQIAKYVNSTKKLDIDILKNLVNIEKKLNIILSECG